jgi:outer membrane protein
MNPAKNTFLFLSLLGGMFVSANSFAQTSAPLAPGKKWTLQACVDYAIENNVQLKQSMISVKTNENTHQQSRYNVLPTVNANGGYGLNGGGLSVNPFTNSTVSNQVFSSNSYSISSSVNVFNGFQTYNNINRNASSVAASRADLLDAEQNIKLRVAQAFLNIVAAQEQLKVADLQVASTVEQAARTEKLVNAGSLPQANYLNIKAQLATEELNIITTQNSIDIAILQLQQLMQAAADPNFSIVAPDISKIQVMDFGSSAQEVYAYAEGVQPSITAAKERVEQALFSLRSAEGGYMPSLSASGSYSTSYSQLAQRSTFNGTTTSEIPVTITIPGTGSTTAFISQTSPNISSEYIGWGDQLNNNLSWRAGMNLSIPIFNGFQTKYNVQNARLAVRNAELSTETARNTLRQTIEQAWLDAKLASRRFSANVKQVESLREAFRSTEQRYNAGALNAFDYTLAKTNLNKAETDLIRFKYDYLFRVKVLDFYLGKPLAF